MTRAVKAGRSNATRFRVSSADLEVRLSAFTARAGPGSTMEEEKPGRASWALPAARAKGREVIGSLRSGPSRGMGPEVFVSKSEAICGSPRRRRACRSFLRRRETWSIAATNQTGSISSAATPENRGP